MTKSTLTLAAFAHDLGAHHRITLEVSEVWHKQYVKADDVTRRALREEFVLNFLVGAGFTATRAAKVMALSRTERSTADQNAYRAAEMKFKYHVVRDAAGSNRKAEADPVATLLGKYAKLTAAQKRSFKAQLASL